MLNKNYVKSLKIQIQFSKSGLKLKEIEFTKKPRESVGLPKENLKVGVGSRGEKKIIMTKFSSKIWNI